MISEYSGMTYSCGDLVQSATKTTTYKFDAHGPTILKMRMNLPLVTTPKYWKRHKLSSQDVNHIAGLTSSQLVLLLSMLLGIELSSSSTKISFGSITDILITSKSSLWRKILKLVDFQPSVENILDVESLSSIDHLPALPKRFVENDDFTTVSKMLHPNLKVLAINDVITGFFNYIGLEWLPISFEGRSIVAGRIYKKSVFDESGRQQPRGLSTRFPVVRHNGELFVVVLDEVILISK